MFGSLLKEINTFRKEFKSLKDRQEHEHTISKAEQEKQKQAYIDVCSEKAEIMKTKNTLEEQLESCFVENESNIQQLQALQSEHIKLTQANEARSKKICETEETLQFHISENAHLRDELQHISEAQQQAFSKLQEKDDDIHRLESLSRHLDETLKNKEKELCEAMETAEDCECAEKAAVTQVEILEDKIAELEKQLREELSQREAAIYRYEAHVDEERENVMAKIHEAEQLKIQFENKLQTVTESLSQKANQVEMQVKDEYESKMNKLQEETNVEIKTKCEENMNMQIIIDNKTALLKNSYEQNKEANAHIELLAKKYEQIRSENKSLKEKVETLERKNNYLREEQERLSVELLEREAAAKNTQHITEIQRLKDELHISKSQNDSFNTQISRLQASAAEKDVAVQVKSRMLEEQNNHVSQLRTHIAAKDEHISELTSRLKKKEKEVSRHVHRENSKVDEWKSKYENELMSINEEMSDAMKTNEELSAQVQKLEKHNQEKEKQIYEMQRKYELIFNQNKGKHEADMRQLHDETQTVLRGADEQITKLVNDLKASKRDVARLRETVLTEQERLREAEERMSEVMTQSEKQKNESAKKAKQLRALINDLQGDD